MLNVTQEGIVIKLEYCLPKYHASAIFIDFADYKNKPQIPFNRLFDELKSYCLIYADCAIKKVDILLDNFGMNKHIDNPKGYDFGTFIELLSFKNIHEFKVKKCIFELVKPLDYQFSDEIQGLQKEIDIIYNELDRLRSKSKKKNKSKRRLVSGKTRQNVFMRDKYTCQICGATVKDGAKLHLDHILPVSKGGDNSEENLQVLCERCNLEKNNRTDLLHDKRKLKELKGADDL